MLESGKTVENQPQMLDALLGHSVYLFCISDFVMDASAALEIETGGCPVLTMGGMGYSEGRGGEFAA